MNTKNTKNSKTFFNALFTLFVGFAMIAPASAQAYVFTADVAEIPNAKKAIEERREAKKKEDVRQDKSKEQKEAREDRNQEQNQNPGSLTR
jgi:hypothetical protein